MLELEVKFKGWFLLKNFDLASMLLLGLGGINKGILEMLACLPSNSLLVIMFLVDVLLNCKDTHYLKYLLFLLAIDLFQSDL